VPEPQIAAAEAPRSTSAPPKAAVMVSNELRRRIVTGRIPVGSSLPPEADLLTELQVSRPTLRAALRILESEDLVTVRRGSLGGVWVNAPTSGALSRRAGVFLQYHDATLDDVHRARAVIEPPAVHIVAARSNAQDVVALTETVAESAALVDDPEPFRAASGRFHRQLVELAGNQTLIVFWLMLEGVIDLHEQRAQAARSAADDLPPVAQQYQHDYERVVELIRAGAATEAEGFWREHLESVRATLMSNGGASTVLDLMT
jgi:DNA-binding FadR family transcriptional regulator